MFLTLFIVVICGFGGFCKSDAIGRSLHSQSSFSCNTNSEPKSWLTTKARGIWDWATVGVEPNGQNFCFQGNEATYSILINYHINQTNANQTTGMITKEYHGPLPQHLKKKYDCDTGNEQIHYCVSYCWLKQSEIEMIYDMALSSKRASVVAQKIYDNLQSNENRIVTVLSVNLDAVPEAHLVQQMILGDPSYCSVYIGMETIGMPYLYEIQVAKVFA